MAITFASALWMPLYHSLRFGSILATVSRVLLWPLRTCLRDTGKPLHRPDLDQSSLLSLLKLPSQESVVLEGTAENILISSIL